MTDLTSETTTHKFKAPEGSLLRRELRALREPARLALGARQLLQAPKGTGGVMTLPGFSTNDAAMAPLRAYLRGRGYDTWGWGLGINRGDVEGSLPAVTRQVERRFVENSEQPLALIGWSLGGVFAREVARDHPHLVSQIITLGTPIYGGPKYTVSAGSYTDEEIATIEARIDERNPDLIRHQITAFYSRHDGAVDWRTCIDDLNPNVENIEVVSSHLGLTLDPTVWLTIAERLAHG